MTFYQDWLKLVYSIYNFIGEAYSWGYDTTGQLGVGIASDDDDKMVAKPRKIESAHLNGYHILEVSIADNHSLFLAKKREVEKKKEECRTNRA